jgi:uncharacterized HAD superfamily protein
MRRIYVDLDDVLAQTGRMFLRVLAEEFDRVVAFEEIRSYHLGDSFRLAPGELDEFMRVAHEPDALATIEPMPGAAEGLAAWMAGGYEIFIVTGRPPATREPTADWLDRHAIPRSEFHFLDKLSQYYDGVHNSTDGALTLTDLPALDFCLAVEDFPGITTHLTRELGVPVALFDRPWNQRVDGHDGAAAEIVRCRDWSEIRQRFPAP